jgi:peptidoglycan/LPS O-acetylase OafA/YrhL
MIDARQTRPDESVATAPHAVVGGAPPRLHLGYLDGIRGLMALYVVLRHSYMQVDWRHTMLGKPSLFPRAIEMLFGLTRFTHFAVGMFIVLSGYCLMLPVARSADGQLPGGVTDYLKRRARRILPPYYAALFGSILLILLIPAMRQPNGTRWDLTAPQLTFGSVISHLLLIHNLGPWINKIDGPMWSVGMEWQIYFLFPLLLLPVWRRFGNLAAMATGLAIGLAAHFLRPQIDDTCPWYIGLFAFGMAAAAINFSTRPHFVALRDRVWWGTFALVFGAVPVAVICRRPDLMWARAYLMDPLVGLGEACLLIYLANGVRSERPSPIARFLTLPAVFALGTFSYSLYLIHVPVLEVAALAFKPLRLSNEITMALILTVIVPLCVILAYLFHLAFEKPFMRPRSNR